MHLYMLFNCSAAFCAFVLMPRTIHACCICNNLIHPSSKSHVIGESYKIKLQPHAHHEITPGVDYAHHKCYNNPEIHGKKQVRDNAWMQDIYQTYSPHAIAQVYSHPMRPCDVPFCVSFLKHAHTLDIQA